MAENNGSLTQESKTQKNWFIRHKITTGAIAIFILLIILMFVEPIQGYVGGFLELYVGLFFIYLIVWAVYGRKRGW
jgi:hypothetical protein